MRNSKNKPNPKINIHSEAIEKEKTLRKSYLSSIHLKNMETIKPLCWLANSGRAWPLSSICKRLIKPIFFVYFHSSQHRGGQMPSAEGFEIVTFQRKYSFHEITLKVSSQPQFDSDIDRIILQLSRSGLFSILLKMICHELTVCLELSLNCSGALK